MPQVQSPKILAFIEGTMERIFVNKNFNYVHVVEIKNGFGWDEVRICDQVLSKFKVNNVNYDVVLIWFDREDMRSNSKDIQDYFIEKFAEIGFDTKKLFICVPDKMTENFILADEELMNTDFDLDNYKYDGDGINGKSYLKRIFKDNGENYKETFHGALLLKKLRLGRASLASASAKLFHDQLDIDCWWLNDVN